MVAESTHSHVGNLHAIKAANSANGRANTVWLNRMSERKWRAVVSILVMAANLANLREYADKSLILIRDDSRDSPSKSSSPSSNVADLAPWREKPCRMRPGRDASAR
jgi:hypothetical protein